MSRHSRVVDRVQVPYDDIPTNEDQTMEGISWTFQILRSDHVNRMSQLLLRKEDAPQNTPWDDHGSIFRMVAGPSPMTLNVSTMGSDSAPYTAPLYTLHLGAFTYYKSVLEDNNLYQRLSIINWDQLRHADVAAFIKLMDPYLTYAKQRWEEMKKQGRSSVGGKSPRYATLESETVTATGDEEEDEDEEQQLDQEEEQDDEDEEEEEVLATPQPSRQPSKRKVVIKYFNSIRSGHSLHNISIMLS
jgi:hypothetical protein